MMMSSFLEAMERSQSIPPKRQCETSRVLQETATHAALIFPFVEQRSTYDPHEIGFLLHKYALKLRQGQMLLPEEFVQHQHVLSLQQQLYIYSFPSPGNS